MMDVETDISELGKDRYNVDAGNYCCELGEQRPVVNIGEAPPTRFNPQRLGEHDEKSLPMRSVRMSLASRLLTRGKRNAKIIEVQICRRVAYNFTEPLPPPGIRSSNWAACSLGRMRAYLQALKTHRARTFD